MKEFFMNESISMKRRPDAGVSCARSEAGAGLARAFGGKKGLLSDTTETMRVRSRRTRGQREKAMDQAKYGVADATDGL